MPHITKPLALNLIYDILDADPDLPLAKSPETILMGKESTLNSISLVSLIIDIETALQDLHSISVTLSDERAFSRQQSPFRTIGSLADYIVSLTEGSHV